MSWRSWNDSLNNIKGQISTFANNVLADTEELEERNGVEGNAEELRQICQQQQEEITKLQRRNEELSRHLENNPATFSSNGAQENDQNWTWEVSEAANGKSTAIADLKKTINDLETEKRELIVNLEQLDIENQTNTEKLVGMKNRLQNEYNDLEDTYTNLKSDYETVLKEKRKLKALLDESNTTREKVEEGSCKNCQEHEDLKAKLAIKAQESEDLASKHLVLHNLLQDSKAENTSLMSQLQKIKETLQKFEEKSAVDAGNCTKIAGILEGYELEVSSLKQKLEEAKNVDIQLHTKYVNILTENVKRYLESDMAITQASSEENPHVEEFRHHVESILNILLDLKVKSESLEGELYKESQEKSNLLTEIEKLIQNSEILSQEVLTKTQTIKDYENECSELIKNNDALITELERFKGSSGLQPISETNEDNILLLESQLENSNKKIEELERIIVNLEEEAESVCSEDVVGMKTQNLHLQNEEGLLRNQITDLVREKNNLSSTLDKMKSDLENTEYQYQELNVVTETLKEEVEISRKKSESLIAENYGMRKKIVEVERSNEEIRSDLNETREKLIMEEDLKKQLESTVRSFTEKLQGTKMAETGLKLQMDTMGKELSAMSEVKQVLEGTLKTTLGNLESVEKNLQEKTAECESLKALLENTGSLAKNLQAKEAECQNLKALFAESGNVEKNLQEKQAECENLRALLDEATSVKKKNIQEKEVECQNLKALLEQAKNVETKLQEKEAECQNLKALLEEKKSVEKNLQDKEAECQNLKALLEEKKSVEKNLQDKETECQKLKALLEEAKGSVTPSDETLTLQEENLQLVAQIRNLEAKLNEGESKNADTLRQYSELQRQATELTQTVITKHQESVTYHNEIQRLTQILNSEVSKAQNLELELDALKKSTTLNEEIEKINDQNSFLKEKCEILAGNLLLEQSKVQQVLSECSEKEQAYSKKLERLQNHLIEVEEHYTQELLGTEERNNELRRKVDEIEVKEKNSSTLYTSASIRANQQVESLQAQLQLITNQRDDLRRKISDAEDHASRQEAALGNLQFVLEQFQKDKDKAVQEETHRIRRLLVDERQTQENLKKDMANLQAQLDENKHALLAASRLSDQFEHTKQLVSVLKEEVALQKQKLEKSQDECRSLSSQHDGKVEKGLIKNLVIGFVTSNPHLTKDQQQILKIIGTVLDFNQQEHEKLGFNKTQSSWLGSLLGSTSQGLSNESLSQAFVKFLENESKPRTIPSLLNEDSTKSRKTSTSSVSRQSPGLLSEIVLPTFADFAQNRNSSSILKDVLKDSG